MDIAKYLTAANAALAVALASMLATFIQAWITRQHNKLSVKPIISAQNHWIRAENSIELVITLENRGIGPGTIEDLHLMADGKRLAPAPEGDNVVEHYFKLAFEGTVPMVFRHTRWPDGQTLRANEDCVVAKVWFGIGHSPTEIIHLAEEKLGKEIALNGTYSCMYGRRWPIDKTTTKKKKPAGHE